MSTNDLRFKIPKTKPTSGEHNESIKFCSENASAEIAAGNTNEYNNASMNPIAMETAQENNLNTVPNESQRNCTVMPVSITYDRLNKMPSHDLRYKIPKVRPSYEERNESINFNTFASKIDSVLTNQNNTILRMQRGFEKTLLEMNLRLNSNTNNAEPNLIRSNNTNAIETVTSDTSAELREIALNSRKNTSRSIFTERRAHENLSSFRPQLNRRNNNNIESNHNRRNTTVRQTIEASNDNRRNHESSRRLNTLSNLIEIKIKNIPRWIKEEALCQVITSNPANNIRGPIILKSVYGTYARAKPTIDAIIKVNNNTATNILNKGHLIVGGSSHTVSKIIIKKQCTNCLRLTHFTSRCTFQKTCRICAEEGHSRAECPKLDQHPVCANCRRAKIQKEFCVHSAFSPLCPIRRLPTEERAQRDCAPMETQ